MTVCSHGRSSPRSVGRRLREQDLEAALVGVLGVGRAERVALRGPLEAARAPGGELDRGCEGLFWSWAPAGRSPAVHVGLHPVVPSVGLPCAAHLSGRDRPQPLAEEPCAALRKRANCAQMGPIGRLVAAERPDVPADYRSLRLSAAFSRKLRLKLTLTSPQGTSSRRVATPPKFQCSVAGESWPKKHERYFQQTAAETTR